MITEPLHESLRKPPGDRLAFLHIPKTAGTSLTRALATHWGRVKIIGDNRILASMGPNDLKDVSLFAGHFYAHQLAHPALSGFTPITVLRDPLARLFSEYRFASTVAKSGQPLPPRMEFALKVSFFDYAFSEAGQAGLHAQLYILGMKASTTTLKWIPLGDLLGNAKDVVSRMRVGVTENLDEFVATLYSEISEPAPPLGELNTQEKFVDDGLTHRQRETLRDVLSADYALYRFARDSSRRWIDLATSTQKIDEVSVPRCLENLRKVAWRPDWRRGAGERSLKELSDELSRESFRWKPAYRLEGRVFRALSQADACATIEALSEVALESPDRRAWAIRELKAIFDKWYLVEQRYSASQKSVIYDRVMSVLERVREVVPNDRSIHVSMATVIRQQSGDDAAIAFLEDAVAKKVNLADVFLSFLSGAIEKKLTRNLVRYALLPPVLVGRYAIVDLLAFHLHRATVFSSFLEKQSFDIEKIFFSRALVKQASDIALARSEAFNFLGNASLEYYARFLANVCDSKSIWYSSLESVEILRQDLIALALRKVEEASLAFFSQSQSLEEILQQEPAALSGMDQRDLIALRSMINSLGKVLDRTLRFWEDSAWRHEVSRRMVTLAQFLPDSGKTFFVGKFSFCGERYDDCAAAFKRFSQISPVSIGPSTYIDHRTVARAVEEIAHKKRVWPVPMIMIGAFGGDMKELPTLIVSANKLYIDRYLCEYAESLVRNRPLGKLLIHVIGSMSSVQGTLDKVKRILPKYQIAYASEELVINEPYFFASARFLRVSEWVKRISGRVIITDIDSPWSNDPAVYVEKRLREMDVGLALNSTVSEQRFGGLGFPAYRYPLSVPWVATPAWILALSGSDASHQFAHMLSALTLRELMGTSERPSMSNWTIDQNILCAAYAHAIQNCPHIGFVDLNETEAARGRHWLGVPAVSANLS